MKTNTLTDFTVQIRINEELIKAYKKKQETYPSTESLDNVIRMELEKLILKVPAVIQKQSRSQIESQHFLKIARVTLGFKNSEIIKLLSERGQLIGAGKFHKIQKVDQQI